MRPIDADEALKALRKCQTYLYDARDPELKIELSSAEAAINNLPTIRAVATDTNVGDTISRQQALDAINHICPIDTDCDGTLLDRVDVRYVLSDLPTAQPEDYTELKREFLRMASYIDVLLDVDRKGLNIGWWFKLVFSDRLKLAMQNKNMTVSELARRSGMHTHTIYLYLEPEKYGRNINPRIMSLETLAEVLNVSIDWLWGRND